MSRLRRALAVGGAFVVVGAVALVAIGRRDETVRIGEWIRSGGVAFRVTAVRRETAIGAIRPAAGSFLVVALEVKNLVVPLDYRFRRANARLVAGDGTDLAVAEEASRALGDAAEGGDPFERELAPGQSAAGELAFDLPADRPRPRLVVSMGGRPFAETLATRFEGTRSVALDG